MWNFELSWWRWGNFEFFEGIIPLTRHHLAFFVLDGGDGRGGGIILLVGEGMVGRGAGMGVGGGAGGGECGCAFVVGADADALEE